jgi:hypothetical protein
VDSLKPMVWGLDFGAISRWISLKHGPGIWVKSRGGFLHEDLKR